MTLILTRPSATWSWTKPTWPSSTATSCPVWSGITLKPRTEAQSLKRSWSKQLTEWADWSTLDDQRGRLRSKKRACVRRQKFRRYAIIEINSTTASKHRSSSFHIEQKDSWYTMSLRKPNTPWNSSSKYESGCSKSRFKQNMTQSLWWMIFNRNSKEMRSRLIKLFPPLDRFGTLS